MAGKWKSPKMRENLKALAIAAIILAILLPMFFGWGSLFCLVSLIAIFVLIMAFIILIFGGSLRPEYEVYDMAKKMKERNPGDPIRWKDYLLHADISSVVPRIGVKKACLILFFIYSSPLIAIFFIGLYLQGVEAIYEPATLMIVLLIINYSLTIYSKKRTYERALRILEKERSEQEGGK